MDWQCQYMSQWNVLGLNMILLSFLCVIYNWKVEVFNFQLIQHLVCHILFNMLNKSYLVWCMWDVFWFFLLLQNIQKMIYGPKSFYRSHIFCCNRCNQDLHLFLLMVLYCKDQHAPLNPEDWDTFFMHKSLNPWETSQLNWDCLWW